MHEGVFRILRKKSISSLKRKIAMIKAVRQEPEVTESVVANKKKKFLSRYCLKTVSDNKKGIGDRMKSPSEALSLIGLGERFHDLFTGTIEGIKDFDIEIVSGPEVITSYVNLNYSSEKINNDRRDPVSRIEGSCMRSAGLANSLVSFYPDNGVKLIVMKNKKKEICGRCLLWDENLKIIDRIYTISSIHRAMFIRFLSEKGFLSICAKNNDYPKIFGESFEKKLTKVGQRLPYLDTMRTLYMNNKREWIISTKSSDDIKSGCIVAITGGNTSGYFSTSITKDVLVWLLSAGEKMRVSKRECLSKCIYLSGYNEETFTTKTESSSIRIIYVYDKDRVDLSKQIHKDHLEDCMVSVRSLFSTHTMCYDYGGRNFEFVQKGTIIINRLHRSSVSRVVGKEILKTIVWRHMSLIATKPLDMEKVKRRGFEFGGVKMRYFVPFNLCTEWETTLIDAMNRIYIEPEDLVIVLTDTKDLFKTQLMLKTVKVKLIWLKAEAITVVDNDGGEFSFRLEPTDEFDYHWVQSKT